MSEPLLSSHFETYFRIVLADTPDLLQQAQRIRYDVYCKEFGFEREENCPAGLEQDEYDAASVHCLVIHKATNRAAGCVRLVKVPRAQPELLLPLEKHCGHSLNHETLHPSRMLRLTICEISRLAVHTQFRRRLGESLSPIGSNMIVFSEAPTAAERRTFPLISVALIAASTSLMVVTQRPNLFIMVETWLATLLKRLGLSFVQIGESIDYHGPRAPYFITVEDMLHGMKGDLRAIYDFVHTAIEAYAKQTRLDLTG